jgi:hypothetical protein
MAASLCGLTRVRRARSLRRRSASERMFAGCAAACRYWSHAGATAELRMLRPGSRPGVPRRAYLHVRMHLVPRLRGEHPARHLPELRRRAREAPHPPGPSAHGQPAIDQKGRPARMHPGACPLIADRRRRQPRSVKNGRHCPRASSRTLAFTGGAGIRLRWPEGGKLRRSNFHTRGGEGTRRGRGRRPVSARQR